MESDTYRLTSSKGEEGIGELRQYTTRGHGIADCSVVYIGWEDM